jgi:hypothetical protein
MTSKTSTERVRRIRTRIKRVEVGLDLTTAAQVAQLATAWNCSQQEILRVCLLAALPALKISRSPQEVFDRVRDGLGE